MPAAATMLAYLNATTLTAMRNVILLAIVFTLLAKFCRPCNKTPSWWRKRDLSTDLCWAIVPNTIERFVRTVALITGMMLFFGPSNLDAVLTHGFGPVAALGFWPQAILYLLATDLMLYATHRLFHGIRLWRFHAVHHSSRHLEWISATRFHPVDAILHGSLPDVVMLLSGMPPDVLLWMMPFNLGSAALVHANLRLGFRTVPLRPGQPGVSPLAPHQPIQRCPIPRCPIPQRRQFRRHVSVHRPGVRHIPHADESSGPRPMASTTPGFQLISSGNSCIRSGRAGTLPP